MVILRCEHCNTDSIDVRHYDNNLMHFAACSKCATELDILARDEINKANKRTLKKLNVFLNRD